MAFEDLLIGLGIGLLVAFIVYFAMNAHLRHRISVVEAEFRQLWAEQEGKLRRDVADRSRRVIKGKIAEQIVPLLHDIFKYDPADARFLGAPIDYVIFDGYTRVKEGHTDEPITVVLADVKTGAARLSRTEKKIKDAVEAGRVRWETIHLDV
ncbi:MAG: endonuclease [Candidatus Thorarchaeota archaeon]|nr:endonuclease [Candidatus Thorarchaeota archaeon]